MTLSGDDGSDNRSASCTNGKGLITVRQFTRPANDTLEARGVDPAKDTAFRNMVEGTYTDYEIVSSQGEVPNTYTLKMKTRAADEYRLQAVDQALRTIENRVNALGVAEPVIQKRGGPGEHEIIVQFPGIDDPENVKRIIGKPALLELKLVQGTGSYPRKMLLCSSTAEYSLRIWKSWSLQRLRIVAARSIASSIRSRVLPAGSSRAPVLPVTRTAGPR